jgi:glycosyltransferase involved in cell wall biosynthesis
VQVGLSSAKLHLLGQRPDAERLLRALDVFVLPSISESFPNALIEAMATGLACIATDVGDCSKVLSNARFVVPPGDPTAVGERLGELLEINSRSRQRIGKQNRDEVVHRFALSRMVDAFDAVFIDAATAAEPRR